MSEDTPEPGSPEYMRLQAAAVDRDLAEHGVDHFLSQSDERVYERYEQQRPARIRQLARQIEGTADYDLRQLDKPTCEALEDGLQLAVDELDVMADALREQQHRRGTQENP